jgi:hypothetical protein
MTGLAYDSDGEHGTKDGDKNSGDASEGWRLKLASEHPEQYKHRSKILQDDGRSHTRALYGEVVEVVGGGDSEDADDGAIADITDLHADGGRASSKEEGWKQDASGKGGAALRQHEGRYKRNIRAEKVEARGEYGTS